MRRGSGRGRGAGGGERAGRGGGREGRGQGGEGDREGRGQGGEEAGRGGCREGRGQERFESCFFFPFFLYLLFKSLLLLIPLFGLSCMSYLGNSVRTSYLIF